MKLTYGWSAVFFDRSKRVALTKPGAKSRQIWIKYIPPAGLKRIDPKSGTHRKDFFDRLPKDTEAEILAECRRRWLEREA